MSSSLAPGCPEPERIAELAERRVSPSQRAALIAHVALCADCTAVLAGAAELLEQGRQATSEASISPRPLRRWLVPTLAAAALFAVLLLAARILQSPPIRMAMPPPASAPAWTAGAAWHATRLGFAPRPARSALQLGRHLEALARVCHAPAEEALLVRTSVRRALDGVEPEEWLDAVVADAACGTPQRFAGPPGAPNTDQLVALGRRFERWRIAAVEHDGTAFDVGSIAAAGRDARAAGLPRAALEAIERVAASAPARDATGWATLLAAVGELIEIVEA